jgi:hypothetical protein
VLVWGVLLAGVVISFNFKSNFNGKLLFNLFWCVALVIANFKGDANAIPYVCTDMVQICNSSVFWTTLQLLVDVLLPFQVAIQLAQADEPISNIWRIWAKKR